MALHQRERGVVADRADVAKVVGDALDLGQDAAQMVGARRGGNPQRLLDGAGESDGIGDGAVAADAAGKRGGALHIGAAQKRVDALVHIAEPLLEPHHRFAAGVKAEVAGLDDARVHRADGDLVQPVALGGEKLVGAAFAGVRRCGAERRRYGPAAMIEPGRSSCAPSATKP